MPLKIFNAGTIIATAKRQILAMRLSIPELDIDQFSHFAQLFNVH